MLTSIFCKACHKVDDTAVEHRLQDEVHGFNRCLQTKSSQHLQHSARNMFAPEVHQGQHPVGA